MTVAMILKISGNQILNNKVIIKFHKTYLKLRQNWGITMQRYVVK
jgi:hypothetical protein